MNWNNVRLIVSREIRDQLRDRRTIFVIAVLPLLLYPLMGMSFLQVAQFLKEHPARIWIIGADRLPTEPPLIKDGQFATELLARAEDQRLYDLKVHAVTGEDPRKAADQAVRSGEFDAVVLISESFARQMRQITENASGPDNVKADIGPEVIYNQAKDKSRVGRDRVVTILSRWRAQIVEQTLTDKQVPVEAAKPFRVISQDLSAAGVRRAALWSKILPFIIIIWAMTGAFYPAVDLCAGEKERGTLETLLSCPASRREIVWGKLLTVMTFSMSTSLLNLISMGITGQFVVGQLQALSGNAGGGLEIGPPPLQVLGWVILILVPISALFSALSLALAAMARSSKEGQYYLMPLMFGTMPLMMLPMLPAVELNLGNSLIPVTGVILLLRSLIEGQHIIALQFALPVIGVTGICCWLSLLWATHQFQDESVLFRESERFDLKSWLIHLVRDRGPLPTVAQAFLCGALLLLARFFAAFLLPAPIDFASFASQTVALQVLLIAGPSLIMAWALTRSPAETLLLRLPRLSHLLVAGLLAVTLHPVASALAVAIQQLYPISEQTLQQLRPLQDVLGQATSLWQILALLALLPAICEELAFRGFVLAGLRRMNDRLLAVLVSSLFFAIAHPVLQQSITAFALGLIVGFVALRTNSILPCMCFHFVHNSLQLSAGNWAADPANWLTGLVQVQEPGLVVYAWPIVILGICASAALLAWLGSSSRGGKPNTLYGTELSPAA